MMMSPESEVQARYCVLAYRNAPKSVIYLKVDVK